MGPDENRDRALALNVSRRQIGAFDVGQFVVRRQGQPELETPGPAVIAEDETTTIITSGFTAALDSSGAIRLTARKAALQEAAQ